MRWNIVGAFIRNNPFGTEIAFRKGLERIGEKVTAVDPGYPNQRFDEAADVTVVFKWLDPGPYRDQLVQLSGIKILYQPDDLRFPHIKQMVMDMRAVCDHAFTFDEDGAILARKYGFESTKRLLLTADNNLYRKISGIQKDIDVCFVGSLSSGANHTSRVKMCKIVSQMKGVKFVSASELFDIGRLNEIYNRSKVVLNHATDVGQPFGHGFGYQCRHFEAGFTGACILSNVVDNEVEIENIQTFDSEDELKQKVSILLSDQEYRSNLGASLYDELYASHLPEHRAREMVEFVDGIMSREA